MADATTTAGSSPPVTKQADAAAGIRDEARRQFDAVADAHHAAWQAYFQPSGVLKNKLGVVDAAELERVERRRVAARTRQLETGAAGPFAHTPAGYRALHRHLFQDVYEWAGQHRTVNMERRDAREDGSDRSSSYLAARFIEQGLHSTFDQLKAVLPRLRAEALKGPEERNVRAVGEVAASHVGGLNYVHAFRDGNGRAMRLRVEALAREAGLHLDQSMLDRERWNEGSYRINRDPHDAKLLTEAIAAALVLKERLLDREREAARGEATKENVRQAKMPEVERGVRPTPRQVRRPRSRGEHDITD